MNEKVQELSCTKKEKNDQENQNNLTTTEVSDECQSDWSVCYHNNILLQRLFLSNFFVKLFAG